MAESMNLWFGKSPKTDDYIRKTFEKDVYNALEGKYDHWIGNPHECLALIILLDQFPRNIYRHQVCFKMISNRIINESIMFYILLNILISHWNCFVSKLEMYKADYKAQGIVAQTLYLGHHRYLTPLQCVFMPCLVLTHAENIHLQKLCVTIWDSYIQGKLIPGDPLFIFENIFL